MDVVGGWKKFSSISKSEEERERFAKKYLIKLVEAKALNESSLALLCDVGFPSVCLEVGRRLEALQELDEEEFAKELRELSLSTVSSARFVSAMPTESSLLEPKSAVALLPTESSLLEPKSVQNSSAVLPTESSLLEPRSAAPAPAPVVAAAPRAASSSALSLSFPGIKIEKLVVDSGQATVYVGIHENSKTKVAIKVMHLSDPNAKAAFREELETLMQLRHPNILRVISAFEKPQVSRVLEEKEDVGDGVIFFTLPIIRSASSPSGWKGDP